MDEINDYLERNSCPKKYKELTESIGKYYKLQAGEGISFLEKMEESMRRAEPRFVIGYDPYEEKQEQVDKVKQIKMKEKKFYHTFDFKDRKITICLLLKQTRGVQNDVTTMFVGYSVCHPDDTYQTELAKKIAVGRAEKESSRIDEFSYDVPTELAFDLAILKGFATRFERLIKNGTVTIKGIVDVNKTEDRG